MPPQLGGVNAVFAHLNRGKRSLALDLKQGAGRDTFLRLLPRYDVVVESFRPGVLDRLGLSLAALWRANPRVVVCSITGYGMDGPAASRAGHDLNYVARAGLLGLSGPAGGPPSVPGVQVADFGGGLYAVVGILSALLARQLEGRGRHVDVALSEAATSFTLFGLMSALGGFGLPPGEGLLTGGIAPYSTYATKDGRAVALAALEPKFWAAFCAGVGIDVDYAALAPGPHQAAWRERLSDLFESRTLHEWVSFARVHDCCLEPVLEPSEVVTDSHHLARGLVADGPDGFPQLRTPVARDGQARRAPGHGEHTHAILVDAGLSDAEIGALRSAGVLGS
jgi:crotonobetainyl-CoA:carnitine CoA-transferase CaiB-like acyl-CoA transferase